MTRNRHSSQPVVLHVSGVIGAGKTTLGRKISKRFPSVVVKDLDEFTQGPRKPWGTNTARKYRQWHRQQTKPVVLVGLSSPLGWGGSKRGREVPIGKKTPRVQLNTWPIKSAYRAYRRHKIAVARDQVADYTLKQSLRAFADHWRTARLDRRELLHHGYALKRKRDIVKMLPREKRP